MEPLTPEQIRSSFRNMSKTRAKALLPPPGLHEVDWEVRDYLGWHDPKGSGRAYLVAPHRGGTVGIELRVPDRSAGRPGQGLCAICHTTRPQDQVVLLVAARAGAAGRAGNTVGTYLCEDLSCSLLVRGLVPVEGLRTEDSTPVETKVKLLRETLDGFLARVLEV